jgi:hypothetical protein
MEVGTEEAVKHAVCSGVAKLTCMVNVVMEFPKQETRARG